MKKQTKTDSISTFLGSDADVDGSINFRGTIRVDGKVNGKISSNGGTLIVGEKASIDADISVGVVIVMGEVKGQKGRKRLLFAIFLAALVGGTLRLYFSENHELFF